MQTVAGQKTSLNFDCVRIGDPPISDLRLHIGCGPQRMDGFVNCDLYPSSATDLLFDCTKRWPFPDNSASIIYSSHTLEHLDDFKSFFREAHRVLREDGNMQIRVPYGDHRSAWWDVEHRRPWHAETFCFLQPGYREATGNAQHAGWTHFFSIEDVVLRVSARFVKILRWRLGRWLLLPYLDCLQNSIEELWVYLTPIKTPERQMMWRKTRAGNAVPCRYGAYRHHIENRPQGSHELPELVDWGFRAFYNGYHSFRGRTK